MSREVWATYSVKDHLDPRALAADIMLFDRLVFPVPLNAEMRFDLADPTQPVPVNWSPNPAEWARWEHEDWQPKLQESVLALIDPVLRKVPWDGSHQEQWRQEYAKATADHLPGYAFAATRTVLTHDLPAYVTGVDAMGPAYRSVEQLEQELGVSRDGGRKIMPAGALSAVLGWELVVPDDPKMTDDELLKETVAFVTGDAKFREHRNKFWDWQQKYLKNESTDAESIRAAVAEMQQLMVEHKTAAEKLPMHTTVRYAFRIAPPGLALAAFFLGPAGPLACAAAGAFLSCAEIAAEKWFLESPAKENEPSPTAFVCDVHRHFGWKE
jgi:hypothetical protein